MATEQVYELDGPTEFYFPHPVRTAGQLHVQIEPGGPLPPSAYEVIGYSPTAAGVTIRYPNAPRDGTRRIRILRRTEPERITEFPDDLSITARALDAEFDNMIQIIQDGVLQTFEGDWQPETFYPVLSVVLGPDGSLYAAPEAHTSGVDFDADLNAGYWTMVADFAAGQEAIDLAVEQAELARDDTFDARDGAEAARGRAEEWAENPEYAPVLPGQYSAYHWAQRAKVSSGYDFVGDYAAGIEITEYNQLVRDASGEFWRVSGQVELPYTTTGSGLPEGGALIPVGDAALRQELADPNTGAGMVGYQGGTVADKLDGIVSEVSSHVTAEADRAEAARDAAFVNADVYADVATGRAAVANGEQFQVVEGDVIVRYRRNSSSSETEVARYLSHDGVVEGISEAPHGALSVGLAMSQYNLFMGDWKRWFIQGNYETGADISERETSRCAVVRVPGGAKLAIRRIGESDRFRFAEYSSYPRPGAEAIRYTKDGGNSLDLPLSSELGVDVSVSAEFTTDVATQYLVVYTTQDEETAEEAEPELSVLEVSDRLHGETLESGWNFRARNITTGKNLADGILTNQNLVDLGDGPDEPELGPTILVRDGGITQWVKVAPGKTYTISLRNNNRSRVWALKYRVAGRHNFSADRDAVRVIRSQWDDLIQTLTVTMEPGEEWLAVQVRSSSGPEGVFVQVEESEFATQLEHFGYKFEPEARPFDATGSGGSPGDREGIEGASADGVVDDTAAIQSAVDNQGSVVFSPRGVYRITDSIVVNPETCRVFDGNGATLLVDGDFDAIRYEGTLTRTAAPGLSGDVHRREGSPVITNIKVRSVSGDQGRGLVATKCFGLIVDKCSFMFLSEGMAMEGRNRNFIIANSHFYANRNYGIHFEEGGDLHQINIVGCHISYSTTNVFSNNQAIYNLQISGCDIEISSYPATDEDKRNFHFIQDSSMLEDLMISGCTVEDHSVGVCHVEIDGGSSTGRVGVISFAGSIFGNSAGDDIRIGGCYAVDISGVFKRGHDAVVRVTGPVRGLSLNGMTCSKYSGGFLAVDQGGRIRDSAITGNTIFRNVTATPFDISSGEVSNVLISNNQMQHVQGGNDVPSITLPSSGSVVVTGNMINNNNSSTTVAIDDGGNPDAIVANNFVRYET